METSTLIQPDSPLATVYGRTPADPRVVIVDGYGVQVTVHRGHVVVRDGTRTARRERKLARIDTRDANGIARILVLAETGYVSLEVLRWCKALGIAVSQVTRRGDIVFTSPGLEGDPRIRRAQILAAPGMPLAATGCDIVRGLLAAKLTGQAGIARDMLSDPVTAARIGSYRAEIEAGTDITVMVQRESRAAAAYWRAWYGSVFVPFSPRDMSLVPSHWYKYCSRSARNIKGEPTARNAKDPVNAMLNYAYAICQVEATHACHITGLDPSQALAHSVARGSSGFAFDLMEVIRPVAESVVLSMLDHGHGVPYDEDGRPVYIRASSAHELSDGTCHLSPPLTHELAERVSMACAPVAGKHAEIIASVLARAGEVSNLRQAARPVTMDVRMSPRKPAVRRRSGRTDITAGEVLSDELWESVKPLVPVLVSGKDYRPSTRVSDRIALAAIMLHEIRGVAWEAIPLSFGISYKAAGMRLAEWKRSGAWDAILPVLSVAPLGTRTVSDARA